MCEVCVAVVTVIPASQSGEKNLNNAHLLPLPLVTVELGLHIDF